MRDRLKMILPVAVLLAGGLLVGLMVKNRREMTPQPREPSAPLVRVVAVEPVEHRFTVHGQGSVTPHTEAYLVSEVAARVKWVSPSFATGGFFEEGDLLVSLDARDYELAVIRSKAALAEANVRLRREEAEASVARKEWATLGGQGEANPLLLREPQLAEARASVESAQANLALAELDLERCQIKAPFAGRVWEKRADSGQFLGKGEKVARIYSVDYAEVRLPLPLDELAYVDLPITYRGESKSAPGPRVVLRTQIGPKTHEWEGRIVRTEGEIDPRTRMLTAVVRVDDPYARGSGRLPLAVGLFVQAEIEGRDAGEVYVAPRAAMRGRDRILIVDKAGRLRFRPVDVLRYEHDRVIVQSGLSAGDLVCISPLDAPVDGMRVRLGQEHPEREISGGAVMGGSL